MDAVTQGSARGERDAVRQSAQTAAAAERVEASVHFNRRDGNRGATRRRAKRRRTRLARGRRHRPRTAWLGGDPQAPDLALAGRRRDASGASAGARRANPPDVHLLGIFWHSTDYTDYTDNSRA